MTKQQFNQINWTDENVKRFWDYHSQFPEKYFTYQVGDNIVNTFKKYFENSKYILDYGCGPGHLIKHLLQINGHTEVTALEFSERSIDMVNNTYGSHEKFNGAYFYEDIIKKNKKFDLITCIEVIEHLSDDYLKMTFDSIKNLLNPNGIAIISTPNNEDLSKSLIYCPESDLVFHNMQHMRSWNETSLKNYASKFNFSKIDIVTTHFGQHKMSTYQKIKRYIKLVLKIQPEKSNPHLVLIATK